MRLRTQLLLAVAVVLLLPWAGYQYVIELDESLRAGQSRTLAIQARAAAAVIESHTQSDGGPVLESKALFAHRITPTAQIVLDGYIDDWPIGLASGRSFFFGDNKLSLVQLEGVEPASLTVVAIRQNQTLFLFFQADDDKVVFHNAQRNPLASGDRLLLRLPHPEHESRLRDYILSPFAPGVVRAHYAGKKVEGVVPVVEAPDIQGFWEDTPNGYNIEVSLPLPKRYGALGVALGDVDDSGADKPKVNWTGSFDPREKLDYSTLIYTYDDLRAKLIPLVPVCGNLYVFDSGGWLQANVRGQCSKTERKGGIADQGFFDALLHRLFEQLIAYPYTVALEFDLSTGRLPASFAVPSATDVRQTRSSGVNQLLALEPVQQPAGTAVVVLQQEADSVRSLSTRVLVKLFTLTVFVAFTVSLAMIFYAAILSWRIRKLRDHTVRALSDKGEVIALPRSNARDEIGELSRGLGAMLGRVQAHNDYQKTLAARLTHELRTPLSVVRTSVEAMQSDCGKDERETLLARACSGSDQLALMLKSLSEATHLEQIIADVEFKQIDLNDFVEVAAAAYRSIYPEIALETELPGVPAAIDGNEDLLRQLMDKLVANAVEFSDGEGPVVIALIAEPGSATLAIINTGSQLPGDDLDLYSPMTSIRELDVRDSDQTATPHLGMGLYVAKLIAEKHCGRLSAANLDYVVGVQVSLVLPLVI